MVVIVCGSRSIDDYDTVAHAIERTGWTIDVLAHGGAKGVDIRAGWWAGESDDAG